MKLNNFALKSKLCIKTIRTAFDESQLLFVTEPPCSI